MLTSDFSGSCATPEPEVGVVPNLHSLEMACPFD